MTNIFYFSEGAFWELSKSARLKGKFVNWDFLRRPDAAENKNKRRS
jgi:hypothetical protein